VGARAPPGESSPGVIGTPSPYRSGREGGASGFGGGGVRAGVPMSDGFCPSVDGLGAGFGAGAGSGFGAGASTTGRGVAFGVTSLRTSGFTAVAVAAPGL
jgi:hypothetical protein